MSSAKHTPGPWKPQRMTAGAFMAIMADSKPRTVGTVMDRPDGALEANANLISAAPDLYEACKTALEMLEEVSVHHELLDELRAAIAKAEGKTQ